MSQSSPREEAAAQTQFQAAQLQQHGVAVVLVFWAQEGRQLQNILRHETKFLGDGVFGVRFDGVQEFSSGSHR